MRYLVIAAVLTACQVSYAGVTSETLSARLKARTEERNRNQKEIEQLTLQLSQRQEYSAALQGSILELQSLVDDLSTTSSKVKK